MLILTFMILDFWSLIHFTLILLNLLTKPNNNLFKSCKKCHKNMPIQIFRKWKLIEIIIHKEFLIVEDANIVKF